MSLDDLLVFMGPAQQSSPPPRRRFVPHAPAALSQETAELLRHRWAAASYTAAGQNWQALFDQEDADHSGELSQVRE